MKKLFGTDGIRGEAGGENINAEMAFKIGQAMVKFCKNRKIPPIIIIGRDTRASGINLEQAVIAGIKSQKGQVEVAGIIPTPGLAFVSEKYSLGVMITASHNDYQYNGFKIFSQNRLKLIEEEELEMEEYILTKLNNKVNITYSEEKINKSIRKTYLLSLLASIKSKNFKDKNIVLDCAHGATYEIAPLLFGQICGQVKSLGVSPDGYNINQECGSLYPEEICQQVVAEKAHIGLAFDGDGDRLVVIDEKGKVLTGDQVLYIIGKMMKEEGELKNNIIVSTVMSNMGFVKKIELLGMKHLCTDVGDSAVVKKMREFGASLGGEEAGHIIFSRFHNIGDGVFCALMMLEALEYFNQPLSILAQEFTFYPKVLRNIKVKSKPPIETLEELQKTIQKIEKELGGEGRVLVRYSGTEPKCRAMVEGRNKKQIEKHTDIIINKINDLLN